jgi:peptidoglycan hydrolase-like protein with peptidoglycan-binding domain
MPTIATDVTTSTSATTSTVTTAGMGISQMESLLASLESQLLALEAKASSTTSSFIFTRDLSVGMVGNDVKQLQIFLIVQDTGTAAQRLAAIGSTDYFGSFTRAALIEFQKKAGIVPASGYFGSITRGYVNVR